MTSPATAPTTSTGASATITIGIEITIPKLIERAIVWITSHATPAHTKHANGHRSASSATGDQSASSATGNRSAAMASGKEGWVMGQKGCALFLVYRDPNTYEILHAWAGIAGRDGIKPMVWYTLGADGKPVEWSA